MNDVNKKTHKELTATARKTRFAIRDLVLFRYYEIRPSERYSIEIRSNPGRGESRIERIVMHRSIAKSLILESMTINGKETPRGSGSCEIFLAENIPNWTPEGIVINETEPFMLNVVNPSQGTLKIAGVAIVYVREELPQ